MPDLMRKQWLHSQGVCANCLKVDAYTMNGRWLCAECAEINAEKQRERRDKNGDKVNEAQRERHKRLLADGKCRDCGKPAYNGTSFCYVHLCRHRRYGQKYRERNRAYREEGRCLWCENNAVEGYKFCEEHLQRKREIILKNRASPSENHPWRIDAKIAFGKREAKK